MTAILVGLAAAVVVASLLGGALPLAVVLTHTRLQMYLSFAAGTMLGAAFFHMLPEAVEPDPASALAWAAVGLLAVFFLERFFAFHHHEAPADPDEPCPDHPHAHAHGQGHSAGLIDPEAPGGTGPGTKSRAIQWQVASFGLAVHSLAGGVALASAAAAGKVSTDWGMLTGVALATVLHKPADALTIVSLALRAGAPRSRAMLYNLLFAMMIPAGMGLFYVGLNLVGEEAAARVTAQTLAFSAGTFLSIALGDLMPELQFHEHDRWKLSLSLLAGVGLMAATALGA
jgi:zinc and cadmium transporter